ncbi:hypothetical protein VPH35_106012 [Triticum aestivum]
MGAPLPPPAYADGEQTDFVLIEKFGYVADREDATTATCLLQGPDLKASIKVTFCAACPPGVSYFCVHATEYGHGDLDLDPAILATEGPSATTPSSVTFDGWKAAKCSMAVDARSLPLAEASWQHTGLLELDSSQISVLMPSLVVDEGTVAFERLHVGLPTLSLRDDNLVYFLAKIDYRDMEHTAYVLALDLRDKTMKGVAEFGAKNTIGLGQAFIASSISKYLKVAPG